MMRDSLRASIVVAVSLIAFLGYSISLPQTASAQDSEAARPVFRDKPAVQIDSETRRDFEKALSAISEKAHIAIVAEGIPLRPVLTDYQLGFLNDLFLKETHLSLQRELVLEAGYFDYDVVQQSANVFLLRKRYSDPMDLPNVTYAEIVRSLKEICDLTGGSQSDDFDPPELRLYLTLTPEQKSLALTGLTVSQLSDSQTAIAHEVPNHMLLRKRMIMVRQTLDNLIKIEDPRVTFGWMTLKFGGKTASGLTAEEFAASGANPFGFYGPVGRNGSLVQQPFSEGFESIAGSYAILGDPHGPQAAPGSPIPTIEDERMSSGMMANALPCTRTLQDAALLETSPQVAETTASAKPANAFSVSVDPAVALKPVCVFGSKYVSRDNFLRALAAVYDLRASQPEYGHYRLGPQQPQTIDKLTGIPGEVLRLLPSPLYRSYLRQQSVLHMAGPPPPFTTTAQLASRIYYYPAVRRLLCLAEPAAAAAESETVPLSSLDPEASRLIAIAYFSSGQIDHELYGLLHYKAPEFLTHPETMCVKFQPTWNNSLFVSLGTKDDSGMFHPQAAGEVRLPAPAP